MLPLQRQILQRSKTNLTQTCWPWLPSKDQFRSEIDFLKEGRDHLGEGGMMDPANRLSPPSTTAGLSEPAWASVGGAQRRPRASRAVATAPAPPTRRRSGS